MDRSCTWSMVTTADQIREHEARLLEAMRHAVLDPAWVHADGVTEGSVSCLECRLEGDFPRTELAVLLADSERPGCVFGLRARLWSDDGAPIGLESKIYREEVALVLRLQLEDAITVWGLRGECATGVVTWIEPPDEASFWNQRGADTRRSQGPTGSPTEDE